MANPLPSAYVAPAQKVNELDAPPFSAVAFSAVTDDPDAIVVKVAVAATPAFKAMVTGTPDGAFLELRYQIAKSDLVAGAAAFVSAMRCSLPNAGA